MTVKVRRLRGGGLVALAIPTLLLTSVAISAAPRLAGLTHDVKSRLPLSARSGAARAGGRLVWVVQVTDFQSLRPGRGDGGSRALGVTLRIGAEPAIRVVTNAASVKELLGAMGVVLMGSDRVRPSSDAALRPGARVTVVRVRTVRERVTVTVPFETLIQYSKDLDLGQSRVVRAGATGLVERTYEVRYRNGVEVNRRLVTQESVSRPVSRLEVRGTRTVAAPALAGRSECGVASWYAGRTSGFVAAHKSLPFGTRVTVRDTTNGRAVAVVINDRGPYIAGRIIDLSDEAFAVLAPLGQGTARVCISW